MNFRATMYRLLYPLARIYWRVVRRDRAGAGCIIEHGGKILLIRHTYGDSGFWYFPGGNMKKNENPAEAAKREVLEEVGLHLNEIQSLGDFTIRVHGHDNTIYTFYAKTDGDKLKVDPGEIAEARWTLETEIAPEELSLVGQKMFELYRANGKLYL